MDEVMQDGKWEFNSEVTEVFDDMLERSIPQYGLMRELVSDIGMEFVRQKKMVIDVGCSKGEAIAPFVREFGATVHYKLFDVSEPMLKAAEERYSNWIDIGIVDVRNWDITKGFPSSVVDGSASLVLSVLTLQFTPIEYRQSIIRSVYNSLADGGAFILVEKVLGNNADIDDILKEKYYELKKANSYTEEQIQNKRKSLEGVLVPITANWNEELLRSAGFTKVDCFWRYLNFAGWVAIK